MALAMQARSKRVAAGRNAATIDIGEVARVAYELFQQRGGTHGCDQKDWFEAERIVRSQRAGRAAKSRSARK